LKKQYHENVGNFELQDGRKVFGTIDYCGTRTTLALFDDVEFSFEADVDGYFDICGQLYDGQSVTLLQCLHLGNVRTTVDNTFKKFKYTARIFPHYIATGHSIIKSEESCIKSLSFTMNNASSIFYDHRAFSNIIVTDELIELLKQDEKHFKDVEFGSHPEINYFTGNLDILSVSIELGELRVHHRPTFSGGSPEGINMKNEIVVTLDSKPLNFESAILYLNNLLRFFELLIGIEQSLKNFSLSLASQTDMDGLITVYRSYGLESDKAFNINENDSPHTHDVLISTAESKDQFKKVVRKYFEFDDDRKDSRNRLRNNLRKPLSYTIDRLIAAANIFDIFPDSAYPKKVKLPHDIKAAKDEAKRLFKSLPDSIERSSMLSAIGRIGSLNLKNKIEHRVLSTELDKYFPRIMEILIEAVNCRNYYVHGSTGKIDYSNHGDLLSFFTDSLEFVFAASDLIDCGWDFVDWMGKPTSLTHILDGFKLDYNHKLSYFDEIYDKK